MIRVLLVDDLAIVREGMRSMLSPESDIVVVGEAADGNEAVRRVLELSPDIVLMDVRMPGLDGIAALQAIKRTSPRVSVVMVTLYDDPDYLVSAVCAGASGYILKDASREELVRTVRAIAEGGAIVSPRLMPQLLSRVSQTATDERVASERPKVDLSEREREVLLLLAEGLTNQQIGERLYVSPTTIKSHVQSILQKLDVSDRTQAAVCAVRWGLIK